MISIRRSLSDVRAFAPREKVRPIGSEHLIHQPIKLLAQKLPVLFNFASILTQNTTQSCTYNRSNLQRKTLSADQLFFEMMIENSYSFQKHSFGTIYWLTSDLGSSIRGICLEL